MMEHPYRPELKAPGNWTRLDFWDPKLAPGIAVLTANLRQETASFSAPAGVEYSIQKFSSFDGMEIACYCFRRSGVSETAPAMLYCHGGGFFLPIQPMMMSLAAQYALELGIRVYLPEYRILPDYPNPYPFQDCLCVLNWLLDSGVKEYLLYGESAGGTLAAGLALWCRDHGMIAARGQCLIYPALDNRCSRYESMRRYAQAAWPLKNNLAMWQRYLKDGKAGLDGYVVPMLGERLSDLPQAYIEPQQIDILRDEAIAYAQRLRLANVPVELNVIPGSYHGFDGDTENKFVQSVVRQRMEIMKKMLV